MNFLAHIYLSGDNELVTLGNFFADGIKGKQYQNFLPAIQVGILLHREIDTFTDSHPTVKQSTKRLHANYSHYSGVIVDIFYDHFLAKNWINYSDKPLNQYVENFYSSLNKHFDKLPENYKYLVTKMTEQNWLLSYATTDGMQTVLDGMNRRTKGRSKMDNATTELNLYYIDFENEFTTFFNDLIAFSNSKLDSLTHQFNL